MSKSNVNPFISLTEFIIEFNRFTANIGKIMNDINERHTPLAIFISENHDRIGNFFNSIDKLEPFAHEDDDLPIGEFISNLIDKNKIRIDDDWTIVVLDDNDDKTADNSESKLTITRIIQTLFIIKELVLPTTLADISFDVDVDNSTTINQIIQPEQAELKYIVTVDTANIHAKPNNDSSVVGTVSIDDIVNVIEQDNGWSLIYILSDNKEIQLNGWVKDEYINPLVDINN